MGCCQSKKTKEEPRVVVAKKAEGKKDVAHTATGRKEKTSLKVDEKEVLNASKSSPVQDSKDISTIEKIPKTVEDNQETVRNLKEINKSALILPDNSVAVYTDSDSLTLDTEPARNQVIVSPDLREEHKESTNVIVTKIIEDESTNLVKEEKTNVQKVDALDVTDGPEQKTTLINEEDKTMEQKSSLVECLLPNFDPGYYKRNEEIGTGKFVLENMYATKKELDLPHFALLKIFDLDRLKTDYKKFSEFNHKNILKLLYWSMETESNNLHIYTEHCDHNLRSFTSTRDFRPYILREIGRQLISGCSYLHSKEIIHGNIKPENIMIIKDGENNEEFTVRIADYGLKRSGISEYSSPEMISAVNEDKMLDPDLSSDIFSIGVVIFEMFGKKLPFSLQELGERDPNVYRTVKESIVDVKVAQSLTLMLQWDQKLRPDADSVLAQFGSMMLTIPVGGDVSTIHYIPQYDLLVVGCEDGSIFLYGSDGEGHKSIFKQKSRIETISHNKDLIIVASQQGGLIAYTYSEKSAQCLQLSKVLLEEGSKERALSIDVNDKYIACNWSPDGGNKLAIWKREDFTEIKTTNVDHAERVFIEHDSIFCTVKDDVLWAVKDEFIVYDIETCSVTRKVTTEEVPRFFRKSGETVFIICGESKVYCLKEDFELKEAVQISFNRIQQIAFHGDKFYCLKSNGELKSCLKERLQRAVEEEVPINLDEDEEGEVEELTKEDSSSSYGCSRAHGVQVLDESTLFYVWPDNVNAVEVMHFDQEEEEED